MAEHQEPTETEPSAVTGHDDVPNAPDATVPDGGEHADTIVNPDGSTAKASTDDGHLTRSDVTNAPLVDGTDPLSDDAIDRRHQGRRVTPQLVIFGVFALVFAVFVVNDVVHHEWALAALGIVVVGICATAIKRELDKRR